MWLNETGAGIVAVIVPDREGNLSDVALGYKDASSYIGDGPCAGKIPGRFANRIALGQFSLDGKKYRLAVNNGPNHLHGGPGGFANKAWDVRSEGNTAEFSLVSPDMDEGYPGKLEVKAVYRWSDSNVLSLEITAKSDAATVINLTNHNYWNLSGEDSGSVLDHTLKLNASSWLPTDPTLVPTGEISPVKGTPMDFTSPKALGRDIHEDFDALRYGKGYDNCWVIDGWKEGKLSQVGVLSDPKSGRSLSIWSTQPGVQIYTGNWLAGSPVSKSGRSYNDYDGVAIECQNFPDAPNKPGFPSPVLRPGEVYRQIIEFRFSC